MYRCLRCGETYDSNELTRTLQYRGEYQGTAAYESERSCPACGYDVEYCGEWSDDGYDYDELLLSRRKRSGRGDIHGKKKGHRNPAGNS